MSGAYHPSAGYEVAVTTRAMSLAMPPDSVWSIIDASDAVPSDDGSLASSPPPLRGICAYTTATFRRMVQLVRPTDCVLEIGSSVGECTALLGAALAPSRVVGVDISKEQLAISKAKYPHLTFERADALTDPLMVLEIVEELRARCAATRGDGDCGGDGDVGGVTAVSRRDLVAAIKAAGGVMASLKKSGMRSGPEFDNALAAVMDAKAAYKAEAGRDYVPPSQTKKKKMVKKEKTAAARTPQLVVFADIGGNRELEALVALLPWVATALAPRLVIVKSQTLHTAVAANGGCFDWDALQVSCARSSFRRQKLPHPLKAPLRLARDGTPICRFHNYRLKRDGVDLVDGSTCRQGDLCPFDHIQCHRCLLDGHTALQCTLASAVPLS